ncbi:MAG: hypothetical protein K2Y23_19760 [Cyanobacteria bacterium]|nr:hypothetical protein [Cyanobacteriota bacterium]
MFFVSFVFAIRCSQAPAAPTPPPSAGPVTGVLKRLKNKGTLRAGADADFVVLDANPADAIVNTRRIARVVVAGRDSDRAALRTGIQ